MTYKKKVPAKVFNRWKELNPGYEIELSLDHDCYVFLKNNFNDYVANLFRKIPVGMYKADLWRICKLYIDGGVYADVDLVPYINLETLDKNIFYSCLDINNNGIFQAFIVNFSKNNPLLLCFILSYLMNNPYTYSNGPTYDMYNCIVYNLNNVKHDTLYSLDNVKIKINIGRSDTYIKVINLYYFPDVPYTIQLIKTNYPDNFNFEIKHNTLFVTRLDNTCGWAHNHYIDIIFESKQRIYLFKENIGKNNNWVTSYVTYNNKKILDSRDLEYYYNKKAW